MFNKKLNPEHGDAPDQSTESGRTPESTQTPTAPTTPGATTRSARGGASTILSEGSKFVGNTNVAGTFRVEGRAEGDIRASESVVVGKTGDVQAKVTTERAVLNGRFQGKIEASDRVELQAGSQVEADIKAQNMVMEDGVQFQGNCHIGKPLGKK